MFSSALIEAFDDQELAFVVGHELGHHMFSHHEVPVSQLSRESQLEAGVVLELYAWSRYAEISADRAGLACVGELDSAARAFFSYEPAESASPRCPVGSASPKWRSSRSFSVQARSPGAPIPKRWRAISIGASAMSKIRSRRSAAFKSCAISV
jgi:Zn-dependent protease with chaperone function